MWLSSDFGVMVPIFRGCFRIIAVRDFQEGLLLRIFSMRPWFLILVNHDIRAPENMCI